MLDQYFDSPFRIQTLRNGSNGPLLEDFAQKLAAAGYAETAARRHIRAAEHFVYWADEEGIPPASVNGQIVPHFNDHLNHCLCPGFGHATRTRHVLLCGVRLFVRYLSGAGVDVCALSSRRHKIRRSSLHSESGCASSAEPAIL